MEPEKDIFEQWSEKKTPWYKKIKLWWDFEGRYILSDIKLGFKNLNYWLPVIWKDRNWDHSYIFTLLKHKLIKHSEKIKQGYSLSAKRDSEIIMLCANLIEKINSDFYKHQYYDYKKDKHWFEPSGENYLWKSKNIEDNLDEYFKLYPLIYKKCLEGKGVWGKIKKQKGNFDKNDREFIAMDMGITNHERCKDLLFRIMKDNIEKWWI